MLAGCWCDRFLGLLIGTIGLPEAIPAFSVRSPTGVSLWPIPSAPVSPRSTTIVIETPGAYVASVMTTMATILELMNQHSSDSAPDDSAHQAAHDQAGNGNREQAPD